MTAHPQPLTPVKIFGRAALWHTTAARDHLFVARSHLDESGYESPDLHDAYGITAGIVATWNGRPWTEPETVPAHIAQSAVEWRRQNGRSY